MSYYSRAHYQRVSPPADTPQAIQQRLTRHAIVEKVRAEAEARYPVVDESNAREALDFIRRRADELLRQSFPENSPLHS